MSHAELLRKWLRWEDIIRRNLYQAFHHRQLWQETTAAAQDAAPGAPGAWLAHYASLYSDGQAMAIRRTVRGTDRRSASLELLLTAIAKNPGVLSAERYAANFDVGWETSARQEYEEFWGDGSGKVDPAKPLAALDELKDSVRAVFAHADKRIAHIEMKHLGVPLTFKDLDDALRRVGEVHQRWALLLTGSAHELTPVPQSGWQSIFSKPLFPDTGWPGPGPLRLG